MSVTADDDRNGYFIPMLYSKALEQPSQTRIKRTSKF